MFEKYRIGIERKIVTAVIDALLAAGFEIAIHNDGGDQLEIPYTRNRAVLRKHIMLTDEDYLVARRDDTVSGWIRLVYGNDGWDVICDYTIKLEPFIGEGTDVDRIVLRYEKECQ